MEKRCAGLRASSPSSDAAAEVLACSSEGREEPRSVDGRPIEWTEPRVDARPAESDDGRARGAAASTARTSSPAGPGGATSAATAPEASASDGSAPAASRRRAAAAAPPSAAACSGVAPSAVPRPLGSCSRRDRQYSTAPKFPAPAARCSSA